MGRQEVDKKKGIYVCGRCVCVRVCCGRNSPHPGTFEVERACGRAREEEVKEVQEERASGQEKKKKKNSLINSWTFGEDQVQSGVFFDSRTGTTAWENKHTDTHRFTHTHTEDVHARRSCT